MDWLVSIVQGWLGSLSWLMGMSAVFAILSRWTPCNPGRNWWTAGRAVPTDFVYWFLVPVFLGISRTMLLTAGVVLLFEGTEPPHRLVQELPLWQQCVTILLIQDFLMYWFHRAFHSRVGWKYHAIHHSPEVVDWMSMVRFHPVNLLEFAVVDVAVILMGFSPAAVAVLAPWSFMHSAVVHANLNWTFGPFRCIFASPVFHRWHHTTQEEGIDTNFAPTFPLLDIIFGTFYMPRGRLPERFGNGDPDFPETFWRQLLHPFLSAVEADRLPQSKIAAIKEHTGEPGGVSPRTFVGVTEVSSSATEAEKFSAGHIRRD